MSLPLPQSNAGDSSGLVQNKKSLRQQLLSIRQAIPDHLRMQYNHLLCTQIASWLKENAIKTISVYLPIRAEPDLAELYESLSGKIAMALPYVAEKNAPLQFLEWLPGQELMDGAFNIPIPKTMKLVSLPEVLLIPCVGYTADRYRLGYGGGFFDRTLEGQKNILTIGVAYSCLKTAFKTDVFDIPLSLIMTEQGMV